MVLVGERLQPGDIRGEGKPAVANRQRRIHVRGADHRIVPAHQRLTVDGRGTGGRGQRCADQRAHHHGGTRKGCIHGKSLLRPAQPANPVSAGNPMSQKKASADLGPTLA